MNNLCTIMSRKINAMVDVKHRFLYDYAISDDNAISPRKVRSVPELKNRENYGVCEPWQFYNIPLRGQYDCLSSILHVSKSISPKDVIYMRKQQDKNLILSFLGKCALEIITITCM